MCSPSPAARARSRKPQSEALVTGEVVEQGRGAKILVFHYKRKKQYKKLRGHRQGYTAVRITEIAFDGQSFKAPELPKKQPAPKKAPAELVEVPKTEAKATAAPAQKENHRQETGGQEGCAEKEKVTTARSGRGRSPAHCGEREHSMAHKKGQGTSRNGRDSNAQRLGFKAFGGQVVPGGTIIVRQRGTRVKPGLNVGRGKDDTLFAKISGRIKFLNKGSMGKFVMVEPIAAK